MSDSNSDSETASLLDNTKLLEKMSNPNSENASLDNSGRKDDELVVEEPSIHQVFAIYYINFCGCFLVFFGIFWLLIL